MMNKDKTLDKTTEKAPIDFSSTSWFAPDFKKLTEHICDRLVDMMDSYPEIDYKTLRTMLAKRNNLHPDNLLITAGGTAAFYAIARAFKSARATILIPSYRPYELAAQQSDWQLTFVSESIETQEIQLAEQDFCFICSPNNPTGRFRSREELLGLLARNPGVHFIVDQSYSSFTTQPTLNLTDIKNYPNLIFVNSFTQTYGVPGLRIGYITADKKIIKQLRALTTPCSVSSLAVEVAKYILIHPAQFTLPIRKWQRNAQELMAKLRLIDGVEVLPSDAPFFLMQLYKHKASDLVSYLKDEHNIIVRSTEDFKGIEGEVVRITSRTEEENNLLIRAIIEFCKR